MSKAEPTIQKYMTCQPHSIKEGETLTEALDVMSAQHIRHLPVMKDGEVFGILSDRDIKMALGLRDTDAEHLLVRDVCHKKPYVAEPHTLLREVVEEMAEKHYGCAIIVQDGELVGIFTTVDACRVISEILQQRFHVG